MNPNVGDKVSWFDGQKQQWGIVRSGLVSGEPLVWIEGRPTPIPANKIDQIISIKEPNELGYTVH